MPNPVLGTGIMQETAGLEELSLRGSREDVVGPIDVCEEEGQDRVRV